MATSYDNRDKLLKLQSGGKSIFVKEKENILNQLQEISVTIRRNEKGYGFELTDGINITRVHQNSPAQNAGILEGDVVKKVNGTCITDKSVVDITRMIHDSNPFVALTLQRKLFTITSLTNNNNNTTANKYKLDDQNNEQSQQQLDVDLIDDLNSNTVLKTNGDKLNEDKNLNDIYDLNNDNLIEKFDFINNNNNNTNKIHKKQNSMSNEEHFNPKRSIASRNSSRRVGIKVNKGTNDSKSRFHQTQSLTDISATIDHSQSDLEFDTSQKTNDDDVNIKIT